MPDPRKLQSASGEGLPAQVPPKIIIAGVQCEGSTTVARRFCSLTEPEFDPDLDFSFKTRFDRQTLRDVFDSRNSDLPQHFKQKLLLRLELATLAFRRVLPERNPDGGGAQG